MNTCRKCDRELFEKETLCPFCTSRRDWGLKKFIKGTFMVVMVAMTTVGNTLLRKGTKR